MRRVLRLFLRGLVVVVVAGALLIYFVYSPNPEIPQLSGNLIKGTIQAGELSRTYLTYVPRELRRGAPLVVVMHGSGEDSRRIRRETGYGFERLADQYKFAVVYPDGYQGYWNACNVVGDYSANKLNIDDVSYLTALIDKLISEIGVDPGHVFATGVSRGGQMAFRLALEAPSRFLAVAAVAANVPTPENSKCKAAAQNTSSVLIMNGTKDPLNPFEGGEVQFFGFFKRGKVRSSQESAQYFADLNHLGSPRIEEADRLGGVQLREALWAEDAKVKVELLTVVGRGNVLPQPYWRAPRILGPTLREPNGPAVIWAFFERQSR